MPITDYNDALIAAKEAEIQAAILRERGKASPQVQTMGKWAVAPHWSQQLAPVVSDVMGGVEARRAKQLTNQANQQMEAEAQQWMGARPQTRTETSTEQILSSEDMGGWGPLKRTMSKQIEPTQQERLDWAQKGVRNPLTKALAAKYQEDVLVKEPEREEARSFRASEAEKTRIQTMEMHKDKIGELIRFHDQLASQAGQSNETRMHIANQSNALKVQLAELQANIEAAKRASNEKIAAGHDQVRRDIAAGKVGKLSDKERKELDEVSATEAGMSSAIAQLQKASGKRTGYLPGLVQDYVPGGEALVSAVRDKDTRDAIQTLRFWTDEIRHGRFGATFTGQERQEAATYLPTSYDKKDRLIEKAQGLERLMKLNSQRLKAKESSITQQQKALEAPALPEGWSVN